MDDIFSALDVNVGKRIFKKVIMGLLINKIVFLITHQLQYCHFATKILVLDEGKVMGVGSYNELLENNKYFNQMMNLYKNKNENEINDKIILQSISNTNLSFLWKESQSFTEINFSEKLMEQGSVNLKKSGKLKIEQTKNIVEDEEKEEGTVSMGVWLIYVKEFGYIVFILLFLFMLINEGIKGTSDLWITFLFDQKFKLSTDQYIYIYSILVGSHLIMYLFKVIFFNVWSIRTSDRMHHNMFTRLMKAKISFFYKNLTGRILNRFSKDQENVKINIFFIFEENKKKKKVESKIPEFLGETLFKFMEIIVLIVIISVILPWFLLGIPIFIFLVVLIAKKVRPITHILQREISVRTSPILSHLQQSITGFLSIHTFNVEDIFLSKNYKLIDDYSSVYYIYFALDFWKSMRILLSSKVNFFFLIIFFFIFFYFVHFFFFSDFGGNCMFHGCWN